MAIYKNKASQKVAVFAVDADGAAKTGDAAQITAQISLDGAACAATDDTNPTELDATDAPGIYLFDLTQAETNANLIVLAADSSTSGVVLRPVVIYTEPETRAADVTSLSGDATAADNAEAFFDGTGYAGTNNVIPTVTAVTGAVGSVTGAVGSVTGNVGGNVVGSVASVTGNVGGSVGSVAPGGITAASIATDAIDADAIKADANAEIAAAVETALDDDWIAARETYWFTNGGVRMIWGALTNGSDTGPTNATFPDGSFGKKVDDYLNYSISSVASSVSSVLAKLGGWAGTTTDTILGAFQALFKTAGATTPADLGTVFDPATDSLPAVYDKVAALPAASDIKTALEAAGSHLALIKAKTDNLPSDPADDSDIDTAIAALKTILDKLDTAMEADGAVYKFTENALEDAPSGGGDDAATVAAAVWEEAKTNHTTAGTYGAYLDMPISSIGTGTGDIAFTYTMTEDDEVTPISGVTVKVSTDSDGASMIRQGITDADGEVVFNMDAGTRYFWRYKDGYYFDNPDIEVVSEDA